MTKLIQVCIAILLTFTIHAQRASFSTYYYEMEVNELSKPNEAVKHGKIKMTKSIRSNKKGNQTIKTSIYNSDGYTIGGQNFDKKGRLSSTYELTYNDSNKLITSKVTSKKSIRTNHYQYANNGQLKSITLLENDQLIHSQQRVFNEQGKLLKSELSHKKGVYSQTIFTYDADGKLQVSETYNRKGKLTNRYDYSCSQEGEVAKLDKVEKKVCSFDAYESGFLIKISETINSKGEVKRTINKFTASDTSLVETKFQDENGITRHIVRYHQTKEIERIVVNNKGIESVKWMYDYNDEQEKISAKYYSKGIITSETHWHYDENGLNVKTEYIFPKKPTNSYTYETEIVERY
jgi:hypothetical protein